MRKNILFPLGVCLFIKKKEVFFESHRKTGISVKSNYLNLRKYLFIFYIIINLLIGRFIDEKSIAILSFLALLLFVYISLQILINLGKYWVTFFTEAPNIPLWFYFLQFDKYYQFGYMKVKIEKKQTWNLIYFVFTLSVVCSVNLSSSAALMIFLLNLFSAVYFLTYYIYAKRNIHLCNFNLEKNA